MSAGFQVLDCVNPAELTLWLDAWNEWPSRDVWGHPHYVRLFARPGDGVRCALYNDGSGGRVIYPFIHRSIGNTIENKGFSDITSAYGYGGPAFWGGANKVTLAKGFWAIFDDWAGEENIVSEFIRWRLDSQVFYPGTVVDRQTNYVARLDLDEFALMRSFESKVRKNVRRAETSGVEIVVDSVGDRLDEFLEIYVTTMDRRAAAKDYYFERSFFEQIHRDLPGAFAYFHAVVGARIVSTELVLISSDSVVSFLGGTYSDSYHFRPNDLLKVEVMLWAKEQGKRQYILGGGAVPGDGIERYKKSFAPAGAVVFQTGQRTLLTAVSDSLVQERREMELSRGGSWPEYTDYFPEYRLTQ